MSDLTFIQELIKVSVQAAVPTAILIGGGRWILNRYDLARKRREQEIELAQKKREQEIELARFVRERQYEALQELYILFEQFMCLYREINSAETDLNDAVVRKALLKKCASAESRVDSAILRIASEFTHDNREMLEGFLGNLRQSVQIWRENVGKSERLPFYGSEQPDYLRFKNAFSNTATYLASQIYERLDPAQVALEESKKLLVDIFSNKWEWHGLHDVD